VRGPARTVPAVGDPQERKVETFVTDQRDDQRAQELSNLKLALATFPTLAEEEAKPPLKAR